MRIYHRGNGPGGDEVDEGSEGGVFFVQEISNRRPFLKRARSKNLEYNYENLAHVFFSNLGGFFVCKDPIQVLMDFFKPPKVGVYPNYGDVTRVLWAPKGKSPNFSGKSPGWRKLMWFGHKLGMKTDAVVFFLSCTQRWPGF